MRYIHLLYAPTMACNMACRYCYLGEEARDSGSEKRPLETLSFAVEKFRQADVLPFNISLHGGEVTTLSPGDLAALAGYISEHYRTYGPELAGAGFRVGRPHIKTNLYALDKQIDAIRQYDITVSGSLDLPLSLHDRYRVDRAGRSTREKILQNIALLEALPDHKKVSATIFHEHWLHTDEIIEDIRWLNDNTCLDMNDFNFMIGFDYAQNGLLTPLREEEQLDFYHRIRGAFQGTELQKGLETAWFAEFGPGYCTNCEICGEKFFLLERNGDIYSCVRGQAHEEFRYGNIYEDAVEDIFARAREKILSAHARAGFDPACARCGWLYLCRTGCPFVKDLYHSPRSYTCRLQQELYEGWGHVKDESEPWTVYEYLDKVHPELAGEYLPPRIPRGVPRLQDIIRGDPQLKYIYDPDAFLLEVDGETWPLASQILRRTRDIVAITPESRVCVYVKREVLEAASAYPVNNALYIQLLSGDTVTYGDEGRTKQRHVATEMVYRDVLAAEPSKKPGWYRWDLTAFLTRYGPHLSHTEANNLFFTTSALRDVHYAKQKNNAFYHMQAMDLPFQNIEFHYLDLANWQELTDMYRERSDHDASPQDVQ